MFVLIVLEQAGCWKGLRLLVCLTVCRICGSVWIKALMLSFITYRMLACKLKGKSFFIYFCVNSFSPFVGRLFAFLTSFFEFVSSCFLPLLLVLCRQVPLVQASGLFFQAILGLNTNA